MRHIEINVADCVIAVPDNQHFLRRLDEVVEPLIDVVSRNPGWPAAGFAHVHGLAAQHLIIGFPKALFREIRQIRIVEVRHAKRRLSSRSPLEIPDTRMSWIVPYRLRPAWDSIKIG